MSVSSKTLSLTAEVLSSVSRYAYIRSDEGKPIAEQRLAAKSSYAYTRSDMVSPLSGEIVLTESVVSYLPGALVNIHSDTLPEVIERSEVRFSAESTTSFLPSTILNIHSDILPEVVERSMIMSSEEGVEMAQATGEMASALLVDIPESIYPDDLPEWIERRIEAALKAEREMVQSASEMVSMVLEEMPESMHPDNLAAWVESRIEVVDMRIASGVAEIGAGKVLADLFSEPRILIEHQRFTGRLVNLNSSIQPEEFVLGLEAALVPLTLQQVTSPGADWVVIHADENGSPGKILGLVSVKEGVSFDVVVESQSGEYAEPIHAMLHVDSGIIGQFEYPNGPDTPVYVGSKMISKPVMLMIR